MLKFKNYVVNAVDDIRSFHPGISGVTIVKYKDCTQEEIPVDFDVFTNKYEEYKEELRQDELDWLSL